MAVGCYMEFTGGTQEQYDKACNILGLDTTDAEWPDGIISHVAGPSGNGNWCVVDQWQSRAHFDRFFDSKLKNAIEDVGLTPAQPYWFEVYNEYRSEFAEPVTMRRAA